MAIPDALDESWGRISPAAAKRYGIDVIYGYLSHDSTKNLTSAQVRAYHEAGIAVWFGWESGTTRPLQGASAGTADANSAISQLVAHIDALGYAPKSELAIPFSLDQDVSASQIRSSWPYFNAANKRMRTRNWWAGGYGEFDLIQFLYGKGLRYGLFQTCAWSDGKISPHASLYQYQIAQTLAGASVDYDRLISAVLLGAWWPPGSKYDVAPPAVNASSPVTLIPADSEDADMYIVNVDKKTCAPYVKNGERWPGQFLGPALVHIPTVEDLNAWRKAGLKTVTVTLAQYKLMGGK
jgi:Domain of unknown function (DUF1906)